MYGINKIEQTLEELLLQALKIQQEDDPSISKELSHQQNKLLDRLFEEWNQLDEKEKTQALLIKVENKVCKLSQQNQACLKKFPSRSKA